MAWILGPKPRRTESGVGVHVEYKLDDGLAAPLPFGGLMKHYIGAAVLSDELNDAIAGQAGRLKSEVLLIKPRRFLDVPGVDHQPVERHDGASCFLKFTLSATQPLFLRLRCLTPNLAEQSSRNLRAIRKVEELDAVCSGVPVLQYHRGVFIACAGRRVGMRLKNEIIPQSQVIQIRQG